MRLDGDVVCQACIEEGRGKASTKDFWERRAVLRVKELNYLAYRESSMYPPIAQPRAAPWLIYRCGLCQKPSAMSRQQLKDPRFSPKCDHESPFSITMVAQQLGSTYSSDDLSEFEAAHIAAAEAWERNIEDDHHPLLDEWWRVCECAGCGKSQAVANPDLLLIGRALCRECVQNHKEAEPWRRAHTIISELRSREQVRLWKAGSEESVNAAIFWQRCGCGGWDLVADTADPRVVLSWCNKISDDEKERLARSYAKRYSLSAELTEQLLEDVGVVPF